MDYQDFEFLDGEIDENYEPTEEGIKEQLA